MTSIPELLSILPEDMAEIVREMKEKGYEIIWKKYGAKIKLKSGWIKNKIDKIEVVYDFEIIYGEEYRATTVMIMEDETPTEETHMAIYKITAYEPTIIEYTEYEGRIKGRKYIKKFIVKRIIVFYDEEPFPEEKREKDVRILAFSK